MAKKPSKWSEVYPQGTQAGNEEQKVFVSLARSKWNWRSVAHVAAEANLTKERVEQILNKYHKKGMVFQNPANVDQWGYWERVPQMLKDDDRTIAQKDQDKRIDEAQDNWVDWTIGKNDIGTVIGKTDKTAASISNNPFRFWDRGNANWRELTRQEISTARISNGPIASCEAQQEGWQQEYVDALRSQHNFAESKLNAILAEISISYS
jgi:hypothetical protein